MDVFKNSCTDNYQTYIILIVTEAATEAEIPIKYLAYTLIPSSIEGT